MVKRCVIEDCTLESELSQFFHFPKSLELLNRWISKLPLSNLTNLNFNEAVICEHHFNPDKLIKRPGFVKELTKNAVPEYFPLPVKVDPDSCRFCFRKITGKILKIDDLLEQHYFNLMQEEFITDFIQSTSCESCYTMIMSCSQIKSKIQENQTLLVSLSHPELLEVKEEVLESDYKCITILDPFETFKEEEKVIKSKSIRKRKSKGTRRKRTRKLKTSVKIKPENVVVKKLKNKNQNVPEVTRTVRIRCHHCKTYVNDMYIHLKVDHPEEFNLMKQTERLAKNKFLECDQCGSKIKARSDFIIHMKIHQKNLIGDHNYAINLSTRKTGV